MFYPQRTTARRLAFTLVEVLVVIAIIATLIALLMPAVLNILKKGPQVTAATEMAQLDGSIQNFTTTMGPKYFPSRIKLCENYNSYGTTQLDTDSITYLTTLFPNLLSTNPQTGVVTWQNPGIAWSGVAVVANTPKTFILEGDQCLVFFLGGIPAAGTPGCLGWSTDQRDPAKLSQTTGRKGPFFEFPAGRLKDRVGQGFYSFLDPYNKGQYYGYFSCYGSRNGYNSGTKYTATGQKPSDCDGISGGTLFPYFQATGTPAMFWNPQTDQIICAGADGKFGPGGLWTKANAGAVPAIGADDQTNFNGGSLMNSGD
jgi:prepilin-type N-terminal cleavage/methylation domain-containing protein